MEPNKTAETKALGLFTPGNSGRPKGGKNRKSTKPGLAELVSVSQFAGITGLSTYRANRAIEYGHVRYVQLGEDRMVDLASVREWLAGSVSPVLAAPQSAPSEIGQ